VVERILGKAEVPSSILGDGTISPRERALCVERAMTDGKPASGASTPDPAIRRDAAKEGLRAMALKANLRRRKAPPEPDEGAR
jgi:hypothetical protein